MVKKIFKGYLRYKTITSQNVSSEAHVKNFIILQKSSVLKIFKLFLFLITPWFAKLMISISAWDNLRQLLNN